MELCFKPSFSVSASFGTGVERGPSHNSRLILKVSNITQPYYGEQFEERKEKLKKLLWKSELSISAYDTAWVAMVPSQGCPQTPRFPQCVNWLLDHQLNDGSWRLPHQSPDLLKDVLQSTLACVLALKKWGIGDEKISKGVQFVELNIASAVDGNLFSPIGFDIIFPGMIQHSRNLSLDFCVQSEMLNDLFQKRDLELQRNHENLSEERKTYLAYVSEGIADMQDWESVMKYQKKNGSLFNSPSTTAAALTRFQNSGCHNYLHSLLKKFGNAVPTVHPLDMYSKLCMVDNLERLGIAQYFIEEINNVMDEAYSCWLQEEEDIVEDGSTCALAFRLLRKKGYDVSSDPLVKFMAEDCHSDLHYGELKDINAILQLYQASEMVIHPDEGILERYNLRSKHFLSQMLSNRLVYEKGFAKHIQKQVNGVLKHPFRQDLERVKNKRNIEHYNLNETRILKTSYCLTNTGNDDFKNMAAEDFNNGVCVHNKELADIESWFINNKFHKLKFARQHYTKGYFSAAATLPSPELSDARISWAKNAVLATVIDDFFDDGSSIEEMKKLVELVERWDVSISPGFYSEEVEILFSALKNTVCELGDKSLAWQGRNVTSHIAEIWLNLVQSFLREAEWTENKSVPTVDEYMANGYTSFALGPIILPALYFIGPKLSEEVVNSSEMLNLFKVLSTFGRLLNDTHGFQRESKLTAASLHMIYGTGGVTTEEIIENMRHQIDTQRKELLKLVLQTKNSFVPRVCKDLFWNMSQVLHFFYRKEDGYCSTKVNRDVDTIFEPISSELAE